MEHYEMPIPEPAEKYYLQTALDRAIDNFGKKHNSDQLRYQLAEEAYIGVIASIQAGLEKYRQAAAKMGSKDIRGEEHNSKRLGEHLRATGKAKPDDRCDAHAIVSGAHKYAALGRAMLARHKIRIDDPDNGCWLPRRSKDTPHWAFPKAIPHSRIHRFNYYFHVWNVIRNTKNEPTLRFALQRIGARLQDGTLPKNVMLPKGQGLDEL